MQDLVVEKAQKQDLSKSIFDGLILCLKLKHNKIFGGLTAQSTILSQSVSTPTYSNSSWAGLDPAAPSHPYMFGKRNKKKYPLIIHVTFIKGREQVSISVLRYLNHHLIKYPNTQILPDPVCVCDCSNI